MSPTWGLSETGLHHLMFRSVVLKLPHASESPQGWRKVRWLGRTQNFWCSTSALRTCASKSCQVCNTPLMRSTGLSKIPLCFHSRGGCCSTPGKQEPITWCRLACHSPDRGQPQTQTLLLMQRVAGTRPPLSSVTSSGFSYGSPASTKARLECKCGGEANS